jgi:Arc/MetJ-type ribon-helix-helix transcriptional regulator
LATPSLYDSFIRNSTPVYPGAIQIFDLLQPCRLFLRQEGVMTTKALLEGPVCRTLKSMQIDLTPDQKAFARRAIETGRLHSEEDAVQEALALWEERERQRAEFLLTLDDARASLARGEGRVITRESMRQLTGEVKERGRARLLAELTTTP